MLPAGRTFYKMSGSGNDFVILDATRTPAPVKTAAARSTERGFAARIVKTVRAVLHIKVKG